MGTTDCKTRTRRATSSVKQADETASRRTLEVFGIIVLATAVLIGPSLAAVQFGSPNLMGPFGQLVGMALNAALGLAGYLVVVALLAVALRVFAMAVGAQERGPLTTLWRKRLGTMLTVVFVSMLLHLLAFPRRLAGASYGGWLGEYCSELLTAMVSRPGTWLIVIAGLALGLVVVTEFSWARSALRLWNTLAQAFGDVAVTLARLPLRLRSACLWLVEQLLYARRGEEVSAEGGTAALPPVVRVEFTQTDHVARKGNKRGKRSKASPMPQDLEIGVDGSESAETDDDDSDVIAAAKTAAEIVASLQQPAVEDSGPAKQRPPLQASTPSLDAGGAASALTIVKSNFRNSHDLDADEAALADEADPLSGEASKGFVLNRSSYRPPPLALLKLHGDARTAIDEQAIQQQAARLTKTLADYKIFGKVTEVHPGPVITMYEFVPAPGTRVSKVASLSNDLAMSLHAERVRIVAPIPGKGAIGIEVPNEEREIVSFKEIVADKAFRDNAKAAKLRLALGKSIVGAPVVMDLAKMPHLLVAGATGAGKSVSVNSMICSLLLRYTPEEVRMILIDPKFLELSGYNDIPHLLLPVVTDPKQAAIALRWAVAEMERRYQLLADMRVRDIGSYNRKVDKLVQEHDDDEDDEDVQQHLPYVNTSMTESEPAEVMLVRKNTDGSEERVKETTTSGDALETAESLTAEATAPRQAITRPNKQRRRKSEPLPERLPYLVVVIDEFADLMMCAAKEVETSVARLAQKARACGIHLIVATQRPSVDVITGLIKANFPSRVAFQVASNHDSKTILGSYGAENLLGAGDMLVLDRGADMKRVHGAFISDDEIHRIIDWLREQGRPLYDMDILKPTEEDDDSPDRDDQEPTDALYDQAVALVAESHQASISMVQRRLRIGYNRAARLVEQMEREGIVGPPDGVKGREVLIQHHG